MLNLVRKQCQPPPIQCKLRPHRAKNRHLHPRSAQGLAAAMPRGRLRQRPREADKDNQHSWNPFNTRLGKNAARKTDPFSNYMKKG